MELFSLNACGIDEVGRGPLAGPVMAACVFIPQHSQSLDFWSYITDSKKLSAKKRDYLYDFIIEHTQYGIGECSPEEIDNLNIHHATLLAMKRAHANANIQAEMALVDGKFCPEIPCPAQAVVKGDSKHIEIAAASIIAKVTRDRMMAKLHEEFPMYGWKKNAGYGTAEHRTAIEKHGITEYHRKSFAPCMAYAA
ncbi:MAG: ribonuclease HII [Pseudomonadota bacterium]